MGWALFPPCCFAWNQTMVEVMKIMATSFRKSHAYTAALCVPNPVAGPRQPIPLLETPGHSQASLDQSLLGSLLFSPGIWCTQGFVCALQESVSPVLCKFCNQIPLASKVKLPGGSQSLYQIPRLGNLLWVLELFERCENFFSIIVLQLVSHLLGSSMVATLKATFSRRLMATS